MIVLKYNDTVYIAQGRWTFRDPALRNQGIADVENLAMWHPNRRKNRLIASGGYGRFPDALRYENIFPIPFEAKYLVHNTYGMICAISKRFGLEQDGIPNRVLFAEGSRAFALFPDGSHIEVEDIFVDCFEDEAVMALYDAVGVSDPYAFFREAYHMIESIRGFMMFPVLVMNTRNNKTEVITG